LNEGGHLEGTVRQFQATAPENCEIVVVDDGSTDGCSDFLGRTPGRVTCIRTERQGAARARNLGARHSNGKVILFADGHVDPTGSWWRPLLAALERSSVGAVAPAISVQGQPASRGYGFKLRDVDLKGEWLPRFGTAPYAVAMLPGAFLAMRRDVFEVTGGFDDGLLRFGFNDAELSLRLWLLGYELLVVPQVVVPHHFREATPYKTDWPQFGHNLLRTAFVHFNHERVARVIANAQRRGGLAAAMALTCNSDIETRRASLMEKRVRDDDWFFNTFATSS
jgi:prepilin-type processing-associated H-X9-DG protein